MSLKNKIIIAALLVLIMSLLWLHIGLKAYALPEGKTYTLHIHEGTERVDVVTQGRYIKYISGETVVISGGSLEEVKEELE